MPDRRAPGMQFASLNDASAIPYINEAGRQGYLKYQGLRNPKAFVIAPDGGWGFASLGEDPLHQAMATCSRSHPDCRYYAVDNQVVWSGA